METTVNVTNIRSVVQVNQETKQILVTNTRSQSSIQVSPAGVQGPPGPAGPPGTLDEIDNITLDGGNF